MRPRYGAKLHLDGAEPEITLDRKRLSFVEAVNYQEFTLGLIHDVEKRELRRRPIEDAPGVVAPYQPRARDRPASSAARLRSNFRRDARQGGASLAWRPIAAV